MDSLEDTKFLGLILLARLSSMIWCLMLSIVACFARADYRRRDGGVSIGVNRVIDPDKTKRMDKNAVGPQAPDGGEVRKETSPASNPTISWTDGGRDVVV